MPEETVVSEAEVSTEKPEINQSSSTEDIIASRKEADDSEGLTPSGTEQSGTQGESETPPSDDVGTAEKPDDEPKEGSPVAYPRFKQVNERAKTLETEREQLQVELEEARSVLQDPEILELALKKRGYTDEKIAEYFNHNSIERKVQGDEPEYDLETVDGWRNLIQSEIKKAIQPVQQVLTQREKQQQDQEHAEWLSKQETEAATLAKDKYGIEFGTVRKDETDPNTAVGKMWSYLEKNPDDAKLGYVKLLKLAMSDDAISKGEEKGVQKEKARQVKLKTAAMESESNVTTEEQPDSSWSTERIVDWSNKHST